MFVFRVRGRGLPAKKKNWRKVGFEGKIDQTREKLTMDQMGKGKGEEKGKG